MTGQLIGARVVRAVILDRGPLIDITGTVSAALRDFAWVQSSTQSRWGYKRAAPAIRRLECSLPDLLDAGVLPRIHGIGPASTRIILEVLEQLLAAPHSKLRLLDDQTDRMLAAVRTPGVQVLALTLNRRSSENDSENRMQEIAGSPRAFGGGARV